MKGRQGRKKATERKLSFNVQLEQLVERDEGPEDSLPQGIVCTISSTKTMSMTSDSRVVYSTDNAIGCSRDAKSQTAVFI